VETSDRIALVAVVISVLSASLSVRTWREASKANEAIMAQDAGRVQLDRGDRIVRFRSGDRSALPPDVVINRNPARISAVWVEARGPDNEIVIVDMGTINSCYAESVGEARRDTTRKYEALRVNFTDPSGRKWKRAIYGPVEKSDEVKPPNASPHGEHVQVEIGGCPS
jgi:hypothetical protein